MLSRLESEVVFVFAAAVLGEPQDDSREHQQEVLGQVGVSVIGEGIAVASENVFHDEDGLWIHLGQKRERNTEQKERTTLPASPPAMSANPMNKNNLALQTALESPNPSSPLILSLSIMTTIKYPNSEQMPGIQSTKETWTGGV